MHAPMPDVHPAVPAAARERAFLEEAPLQPEHKLRVVVVLLQRPVPIPVKRRRSAVGGSGQAPERRRSLPLARCHPSGKGTPLSGPELWRP